MEFFWPKLFLYGGALFILLFLFWAGYCLKKDGLTTTRIPSIIRSKKEREMNRKNPKRKVKWFS